MSETDPGQSLAPRHVHFVAIGGTGMGSLACLLAARGVRVTGSDRALYPPMSGQLERWGIPVKIGFAPENVLCERPDLVVIGNAVRPDNAEAQAVLDNGIPYLSFPDALYQLAMQEKHRVVVAGTHGKTTTTSLVGALLLYALRDPSLLVGGISLDFEGSFREGRGEHFVVEGDEYDTAFFDKTPKFLHYHPRTLVLTSVEFDHADIYRDLAHVKSAFRELVERMIPGGTIVAAMGHPNVREVVKNAPCQVVSYAVQGSDPGATGVSVMAAWWATDLQSNAQGTRFNLHVRGREAFPVQVPLHGRHNVENALAALATARVLGVPLLESIAALQRFRGVKRRMEVRGEARGVSVVDDFAHHPTAVRGSIEAARGRFPGRRLVAVLEPRTNTSRRRIFQQAYADALAEADVALVSIVPDAPLYSATGEVTELLDAEALAAALRARGRDAGALPGADAIVEELARSARPGDVILVMSNGDFGGIWEKLLARLQA